MLHQMLLEQRRKAFEQGGDFGFVEHPGGDEQLARRHGCQRKVRFDSLLDGFDAVVQHLVFFQVVLDVFHSGSDDGSSDLRRSKIWIDGLGTSGVRYFFVGERWSSGGVDGAGISGQSAGCGRTRGRIADRLSGIRSHCYS